MAETFTFYIQPWYRKSPYFDSTKKAGCRSWGLYNHMLLPTLYEDPVAGLDLFARLLQAQGRVLPMAAVPLTIEADVSHLDPDDPTRIRVVSGQAQVAVPPGTVETVRLVPADPPAYRPTA